MTARSETFYRYAGEIAQDLDTAVVSTLDAAPPACSRDESGELEAFASADELAAVIRVLRSGLKSIHVAGISGDVGRDAVLLSLARVLAETGRRILVVDADADGPPLAEPGSVGLTDILAGTATIDEAVVPSPGYEGMMAFIPVGSQIPALEAPGAVDPFARALADLRPSYDVTLVSAPCLDRRGKVHPSASSCEGVLLVLSPSVVSRDRIRRNFLQLWGVEAPIRGLITLGVPDVLAEVLPQEHARTELETLPKPSSLTLARGEAAMAVESTSGTGSTTTSAPESGDEEMAASSTSARERDDAPGASGGGDEGDEDDVVASEAGEISFDASDDEMERRDPMGYPYAKDTRRADADGGEEDDEDDYELDDYDDDTYEHEPAAAVITDDVDYDDDVDGGRGRLMTIGALVAVILAAAAWLWPQLSDRGVGEGGGTLAAFEKGEAIPDEAVITETTEAGDATRSRAIPPPPSTRLPEGARGDGQPAVPDDSRWESVSAELAGDPTPTGKSWIEEKATSDERARNVAATEIAGTIPRDQSEPPTPKVESSPTSPKSTTPRPPAPRETATASATKTPPPTAAVIDAKSSTVRSAQFAGRNPFFAVHITSFRKRASALADGERLSRQTGHPTEVVECYLQGSGGKSGTWYRVLVGEFADRDAATVAKNDFIDRGITDWCRVYHVTSTQD